MVGTGALTTTGYLAGDLGTAPRVMWIWIVGAVCALLGAMCYSELGINLPSSGGEYVYLTRAFGPTWGFMSGWVSFFAGFSAPIAGSALAFADYLGHVCKACAQEKPPVLFGSGDWTFQFGKPQMFACALVALFTVLNIFGLQRSARVQNVLTAAKIAIIVLFIVMAFTVGHGSWSNFSQTAVRTSPSPRLQSSSPYVVCSSFISPIAAGTRPLTLLERSCVSPRKRCRWRWLYGTALVALLYLILNVVYIYAAPLETLKGETAVGALAASHLFGPDVAGMFSALMALSLMASVNAQIVTGPRVYYAMAKNSAFPALNRLQRCIRNGTRR